MPKITWKTEEEVSLSKLTEARASKRAELSAACTAAVYAGFESTAVKGKSFGFNEHDQANFTQMLVLIIAAGGPSAYTQPIEWKTKQGTVETLTTTQFVQLISEAEAHKKAQQRKFWTLEVQMNAATTVEEIQAVTW